MFDEIEVHCPNFRNYLGFSKHQQLIYLLSSGGRICNVIGKFCYLAFQRRNEFMFEIKPAETYSQPTTSRYGRHIKPPDRLDL